MKTLAVLLTCFNRKESTLNCLKALKNSMQNNPTSVQMAIYLVDDGSTDGTSEAVASHFPEVKLIKGTGSLYWAGGMRLAWKTALETAFDYYLLLNDDTILFENSISKILKASSEYNNETKSEAIFVGSTIDKETGKQTYGGRKLYSRKRPANYLVKNESSVAECDLGNGNIMLVPHEIVKSIGILSEKYIHTIADHDYTLKAKEHGFKVFVAPGALGYCSNNVPGKIENSGLKKRIEFLYSHKGISYNEYLYFIRSHFPSHYPAAFIKLWMKTLVPEFYAKLKNKKIHA